MVASGAVFRKDTRSGVSWCHPLPCDAFAAVTDLSKNYVQMRMETKKKKVFTTNWLSFRPDYGFKSENGVTPKS